MSVLMGGAAGWVIGGLWESPEGANGPPPARADLLSASPHPSLEPKNGPQPLLIRAPPFCFPLHFGPTPPQSLAMAVAPDSDLNTLFTSALTLDGPAVDGRPAEEPQAGEVPAEVAGTFVLVVLSSDDVSSELSPVCGPGLPS